MSRSWLAIPVLAMCAFQAPQVEVQTPDFFGTWVLDEDASRVTPEAGLGTFGAVGTPARLHITHAANGDLALQSDGTPAKPGLTGWAARLSFRWVPTTG